MMLKTTLRREAVTNVGAKGLLFSTAFLCWPGNLSVFAQMNYAERMAETVMKQYPDSMVVKKFPQHLRQDGEIRPNQSVEDAQSNRPPRWSYEIKEFIRTEPDGTYHFIQIVSGAGLGGDPYRDGSYDYYVSEPKRDDDLKAIGPFIQACLEIENMN